MTNFHRRMLGKFTSAAKKEKTMAQPIHDGAVDAEATLAENKKNAQEEAAKKNQIKALTVTQRLQLKVDALTKLAEKRKKAKEEIVSRNQVRTLKLNERIAVLKAKLGEQKNSINAYSKNRVVNTYLTFAQNIQAIASDLEADIYCGHGVQALPAIHSLKSASGGATICDVIEIPEVSSRLHVPNWDPVVLSFIENAFDGYLRKTDQLLTVGWELKSTLLKRHSSVNVIPNYRKYEEPVPNDYLRELHGIPPDAKIILCISTLSASFEQFFSVMSGLPEDVHLVTLGNFSPASIEGALRTSASSMKLDHRIHFTPQVPYKDLIHIASSANIGLILLDSSIANIQVSLPNRVFDYLAAGLPILSTHIVDIDRLLSEARCGFSVHNSETTLWVKRVIQTLDAQTEMSENAKAYAAKMTWESLEPKLKGFFLNKGSVTFVGLTDLAMNNRTMRMCHSLRAQGVIVKIACPFLEDRSRDDCFQWFDVSVRAKKTIT